MSESIHVHTSSRPNVLHTTFLSKMKLIAARAVSVGDNICGGRERERGREREGEREEARERKVKQKE